MSVQLAWAGPRLRKRLPCVLRQHTQIHDSGTHLHDAHSTKPRRIISTESHGYPHAPGIFTEHQISAWRRVTDAVHLKGGKILCQLWHIGRVAHTSWVNHPLCKPLGDVWQPGVSASAIAIPGYKVFGPSTLAYCSLSLCHRCLCHVSKQPPLQIACFLQLAEMFACCVPFVQAHPILLFSAARRVVC